MAGLATKRYVSMRTPMRITVNTQNVIHLIHIRKGNDPCYTHTVCRRKTDPDPKSMLLSSTSSSSHHHESISSFHNTSFLRLLCLWILGLLHSLEDRIIPPSDDTPRIELFRLTSPPIRIILTPTLMMREIPKPRRGSRGRLRDCFVSLL